MTLIERAYQSEAGCLLRSVVSLSVSLSALPCSSGAHRAAAGDLPATATKVAVAARADDLAEAREQLRLLLIDARWLVGSRVDKLTAGI